MCGVFRGVEIGLLGFLFRLRACLSIAHVQAPTFAHLSYLCRSEAPITPHDKTNPPPSNRHDADNLEGLDEDGNPRENGSTPAALPPGMRQMLNIPAPVPQPKSNQVL